MTHLNTVSLMSVPSTPAVRSHSAGTSDSRSADPRRDRRATFPRKSPRSAIGALLLLMGVAGAAITFPGCSQLNFGLADLSFNKDDEPGTPTRMIPVWTDTVLTRAGKPGVRGFGGRIVFYEDAQQQPIRVDGSLIVYAWDDTDAASLDKVPDRKYVITADQLPAHFSTSRIGASYSVWIPWDKAGGEHRKVTLITRFVGRNGAEVVSQPMDAVLPGPTDDHIIVKQSTSPAREPVSLAAVPEPVDQNTSPDAAAGSVQPASWQKSDTPTDDHSGSPRMRTTTFDVSPAFAAQHFGDNSAPLPLDVARFGHHQSSFDRLSEFDQQREIDEAARADRDAQAAALRVSEDPSATANPAPSAHSAPTPRPAQAEQPRWPTPSPLRSQPHRAAWRRRP